MRWFVWVVAICLMAAGVARPATSIALDHHDAAVEDASELATLVPRRPTTFTPDKRTAHRLVLHAAPPRSGVRPIARTLLASSAEHVATASGQRGFAQSSRGPPSSSTASDFPSS